MSLFILLSLSCKEKHIANTKQGQTTYNNNSIDIPTIKVSKEKFTQIDDLHFKHSVGGNPIEEETLVSFKYDADFLEIKFECRNNPRLNQNYYTKDNSSIFTQEVFELFISNGKEARENYLEIQLNPNNALFLGKVTNRYKSDHHYALELIDTRTSGIKHNVEKDVKNNIWKGYLKLPLKLLQYPDPTPNHIYRLNMFRVISNVDHTDKKWSSDMSNSTFGCWNSTMSNAPQFHVPDYFGILILD